MPASRLKLFLFDLDGTLVSTGGAGLRALELAFEKLYGVRHMTRECNPQGKTDPAIFREVIRRCLNRDMSNAEYAQISNAYLRYLSIEIRHAENYRVMAGVESFLDHLMTRGDILLGLGTGNLEAGARLKLVRSQLNPYFPFGGFGSDAEARFEVLRHGHRRAEDRCGQSISPDNVFVIGDTELDVEAAKRAGYRSVAVAPNETGADRLKAADPDYFLNGMSEGFHFLKEIEKPRFRVMS